MKHTVSEYPLSGIVKIEKWDLRGSYTLAGKLPAAAAHILDSVGCFPAQKFLCLVGICPENRQIAVTAGTDHIRQFDVVYLLESIHQLQHGDTIAGAQVDGLCAVCSAAYSRAFR